MTSLRLKTRTLLLAAAGAVLCLPAIVSARAAMDLETSTAPAPMGGIAIDHLYPDQEMDPSIPTQKATFGFLPGARPLRHAELMHYLNALAAASPRVRLIPYARSYEGRPLVVVAIGDEATISRLDDFKVAHARLADPASPAPPADAPAVAWMAYGIHGDELSSSDAAAALAFYLAAGRDERVQRLLRNVLVLIDPCENPDGRERFLAQTGSFAHARPSPDVEDLSHATIWPWGRGNHYLFDLNRDWFTMVQPESARSSVIASWSPQLMVDSHEMGADDTYLFSPPRHPFNPFLPSAHAAWADRYASDQAHALDARGYAYYTREWNEEFFPGYGSSWASYLGAIGILYEMSSTEGTLVRQPAGTTRTYAQAVEHHLTSSIANLETLASNRAEAVQSYISARREAVKRGSEGMVRAWIFPPGRYPERADALAALLRSEGITVLRLASPIRAGGLRDIRSGESGAHDLPAGTWMVPMDQPASLLARVVLDPHIPMESKFLREEREYLERGKGTRLYDTTAWSLPLAYGIEAYWSGSKPGGDWKSDSPAAPAGSVESATQSVYGYVFEGVSDNSIFALADLLQRGIAVRVAEKPFRVAGHSFGAASILIKREGNPADLAAQVGAVAERWHIPVASVFTAKASDGPDLGGTYFHPLVAPRIGVFTGPAVGPASYGAIWHTLDIASDLRFTALDLARFSSSDLARYNVLIFPSALGSPGTMSALLGKSGLERLKRWIEAGGTAIGVGSGASFLADKDSGLTKTRLRSEALSEFPPMVWGISAEQAEAAGPFRAQGLGRPSGDETGDGSDASGSESPKSGKPRKINKDKSTATGSADDSDRASPYDIAPVLGPGAKPFAAGFDQGTPVSAQPTPISAWLKPVLPPGQDKPKEDDIQDADERLREFSSPGAFLRVDLDTDLWLNWGLPSALTVYHSSSDALVAAPPVQVAARFSRLDDLQQGGLLWPEAAARIARTAYATREGVGRGQIILFEDEPVFRGWMLGTRRLFLNAVLYGPGLGTQWSIPW